MSSVANVFTGDLHSLDEVDIDGPLATAKALASDYYFEPYKSAGKVAEERGNKQAAAVYQFLQTLVGFATSFDTPAQPFIPMFQSPSEGRRTGIPADLTPSDIEAVRQLAKKTADPALSARLNDILWERTKDVAAGTEAARCYSVAAERLDSTGDWTLATASFQRSLYLAGRFGRAKKLFEDNASTLIGAARGAAADTDKYHCSALMGIMLAAGVGDPKEFAALASTMATQAKGEGDFRRATKYREREAEWLRLARNPEAERQAMLEAAEASVADAEARADGPAASFMVAANLLTKAIEALRRAGSPKDRIDALRAKLDEWQRRSLTEFESIRTKVDVATLVQSARDSVKGKDLQGALLVIGFGQTLTDPKKLRDEVLARATQSPIAFLIGGAIVDRNGRVIAHKRGFLDLKGEELEAALEAESFTHATTFDWKLRADAFIDPARIQILNEHRPTFADLSFIVQNNPFIPPGHENIFLRGLHAGFHGDFLVASHLLTPQIENSLRYVLESLGIDVTNLMSDGTQPVKVLGAILGMPKCKEVFGQDLCFELRGCLIEKTGYDFRNHVAHGFVDEDECYSHAAVTVWWLVLRICLMPLLHAANAAPSAGD